jgi:hypothetical protein
MSETIYVQRQSSGWRATIDGEPAKTAFAPERDEAVRRLKGRFPECGLYSVKVKPPQLVKTPTPTPPKAAEPVPATPPAIPPALSQKELIEFHRTALAKAVAACDHTDNGASALVVRQGESTPDGIYCTICASKVA